MPLPTAYFWSKAPFTRLLFALVAGIVLQWQLQFSFYILIVLFSVCFISLLLYYFVPVRLKYKYAYLNGLSVNLLIIVTGALLVWLHDICNNKDWIGNIPTDDNYKVVTIEEPLEEKTNSFKALASVNGVYSKNNFESLKGEVVVYFKKDAALKQLHYGSRIIFKKPLQEIKNAGNPGGFDYKQYSLFQGVTHQINLSQKEFKTLPTEKPVWFHSFIFSCRRWVVSTLQKFIAGEKEQGLAEALLIGYKDDLDKNLVQSYTNTGVVHIIAISGMHLALIYGLLLLVTKPLRRKHLQLLRVVLILSGLWLFTLLAGAQASVVRSAVMFTCVAIGEALSKKTSIYNTLALSAFILLSYDPFWLWDVGFQLSYAAVVSIVTFYRPIYNWFYFPNKILDFIWKTMAISIAAQVLTTPIGLYHFHQFPVLFLLTNIVAVPLSGLILFGEILLCAISWLPLIATYMGKIVELFIYWMNSYIEMIGRVSFSLWDGFSISISQAIILSVAAIAICFWLIDKRKWLLWTALGSLFSFTVLRSLSFNEAYSQKKLIVYNVPKYTAIDLIDGRTYNFVGDSALLYDDFIRNFHIQPSRVLHRMNQNQVLPINCRDFEFCNKQIAIIDSTQYFTSAQSKQRIDVLILSGNPKLYIANLLKTFEINQIVIDGSVPQWKAKLWKSDCDSLNIHCFDVSENGAFVMNL